MTLTTSLTTSLTSPASPTTTNALVIRDLTVRHGERVLLDQVSLTAAQGHVTALIGPNGAGKSTLIAAALGLLPCTHGSVFLSGQEVLRMDRRARALRLGYVPQRSQLTAPLSVNDVVSCGRYALNRAWNDILPSHHPAVDEALAAVDATSLANRRFNELSAGEAQRVLVARALAGGARTLLLDEPTAALDIGHALSLLSLLRRLAENGFTILVALQQLDEVRRVADHVVLIDRGHVLLSDTAATVLASAALTKAFGVEQDPLDARSFRLPSGSSP